MKKRDQWAATVAFFVMLIILILGIGMQLSRVSSQPHAGDNLAPGESTTRDTETVEARVVRVSPADPSQPLQRIELEFVSGARQGESAKIEYSEAEAANDRLQLREGEHVLVDVATLPDGERTLMIMDYVRTGGLAALGALFFGLTIFVSRWKGVRSLIGLAISFVILMGFVLPQILAGRDPVLVSVVGSFVLLAVTLYLTTGWSLVSHASLLGILFSLILIGFLSTFAVGITRLNGSASEDALTLQSAGIAINLRGLLLAGMIIGTLGVLDDVVVSQASAVMQLADANPSLGWRGLYQRAMNIGNDHIAAVVNTLVMAYVGAAMPLLLLFQVYPEPWSITINREFITEEIVRTLVGSLGLVSAVPIATITASLLREWQLLRQTPRAIVEP